MQIAVEQLFGIGVLVGVGLLGLLAIGMIFARLYRRSSKELAFVRTGLGGQKVVMDGGAIVLPIFHECVNINMKTLKLEVSRAGSDSLITLDRLRVDAVSAFFVRVIPSTEGVANAAQTLGQRTMHPDSLKELVEDKFVDALRAAAVSMSMHQLLDKRADFIQAVQNAVSEDLLKNGLELESVSLTRLDQTPIKFFDAQNAFDAEGLTKLTQQTQQRARERNEIEQDTSVAIAKKNYEATQLRLTIEKDQTFATLHQHQEVATKQAQQSAEIASVSAQREREAQQAKIDAERLVQEAEVEKDRAIKQRQIEADKEVQISKIEQEKQTTLADREKQISIVQAERQVQEAEVEKKRGVQQRQIEADRTLQEAEVEKKRAVQQKQVEADRSVQIAKIDQEKQTTLADQDRLISIAEKSRLQSEAEKDANEARALAVQAEEQVTTVREVAMAQRDKQTALVAAEQDAEKRAIQVRVAAEAAKDASRNAAEAEAITVRVAAEAEKNAAENQAEAVKIKASAQQIQYQVDAKGIEMRNAALNTLATEQIAMQVKMKLLDALPGIIAASVKPMEKIDGIKIIQVDGLNRGAGTHSASTDGAISGNGNLAEQAVSAALAYRAQQPILDALLGEIGMKGGSLNGLVDAVRPSVVGELAAPNETSPATSPGVE